MLHDYNEKITKAGRYVFAICIMAFGIQQMLFHEFLTIFMPLWPDWIPGHKFSTYFFAVFLIVIGMAIILNLKARLAALVLGVASLLLLVFVHVPFLIVNRPHSLLGCADAFTILALAGSAFIVAGTDVRTGNPRAESGMWVLTGRICFSITLITFGFEHFLYTRFVASLVPAWIPGHVFWTYLCGTALIGSGLAIISGIWLRQVSMLLGVMLFLWVVLLHIPRAIADPYSGLGGEWSSVFQALAFSGVAFILAGRNTKGGS